MVLETCLSLETGIINLRLVYASALAYQSLGLEQVGFAETSWPFKSEVRMKDNDYLVIPSLKQRGLGVRLNFTHIWIRLDPKALGTRHASPDFSVGLGLVLSASEHWSRFYLVSSRWRKPFPFLIPDFCQVKTYDCLWNPGRLNPFIGRAKLCKITTFDKERKNVAWQVIEECECHGIQTRLDTI